MNNRETQKVIDRIYKKLVDERERLLDVSLDQYWDNVEEEIAFIEKCRELKW